MWERRLSNEDPEDGWREMWVWGYAFMVGCWLFIAPRLPEKKFKWALKVRKLDFLTKHPARRFEHFVGATKQPSIPPHPFQLEYSSQRPQLYRRIFETAVFRPHRYILGSGALALTLAWWLRSAYYIHFRYEYDFLEPDRVRVNFAAGAKVHAILLPLSSFILSFYVVFHVHRLYTIMDLAWKVQGRIYDIAILLGMLLMPYREDTRVQHSLFRVHRLLNLVHVMAYEEVSEGVRITARDGNNLINSGLVTQPEYKQLEDAENRASVVFVWLSNLTNRLLESGIVPKTYAASVLEAQTELMDAITSFQSEVGRYIPPHVAHLMQFMADLMCLLTPAMLAHVFHMNDPSSPTYFWPWAGSMVAALFYQGIMSFAQALELPFDEHADGLNPDWALMTTERQIFGCLAGGEAGGPAKPLGDLNLTRPRTSQIGFGENGDAIAYGAVSFAVPAARPEVAAALAPFSQRSAPATAETSAAAASSSAAPAPDLDMNPTATTGSIDEIAEGGMPAVKKEKVPLETHPPEIECWMPREANLATAAATPAPDTSAAPSAWGTLDMELLQATRAAILVPREITLDDVSLERLESVTARPLSELAAALLRAEPTGGVHTSAPLALTESAHVQDGSMVQASASRSEQIAYRQEVANGNGLAEDIKGLIAQYHHKLNENSDTRAQIMAVETGQLPAWQIRGEGGENGSSFDRRKSRRSTKTGDPGQTVTAV